MLSRHPFKTLPTYDTNNTAQSRTTICRVRPDIAEQCSQSNDSSSSGAQQVHALSTRWHLAQAVVPYRLKAPPSMTSSVPVTYDEYSLARNITPTMTSPIKVKTAHWNTRQTLGENVGIGHGRES
jgi:hypothetical protein